MLFRNSLAGALILWACHSAPACAKDFFFNDSFGGKITPTEQEARQSWTEACETWKQRVRSIVGPLLASATCGSERTSPFQMLEWEYDSTEHGHVHGHWEPYTAGYQTSSMGLIQLKLAPDQNVSQYQELIVGETIEGAESQGYELARESYARACQVWRKASANKMGSQFIFASCLPNLTTSGNVVQTDYSLQFGSTGSVFYLQ